MRDFIDYILKNLWNLIAVIGVFATFYFSIFYVPEYVKNLLDSKESVIHEDLMDDIQEILFYEKDLSIEDIISLIRGKELKQGITYDFTPDELLVQVQERFMSNKFIPLDKRESLLNRIKSIRANYKPLTTTKEKPFDWEIVATIFSTVLGVLFSAIGAASVTRKFKADNEIEIDFAEGGIAVNDSGSTSELSGKHYEKMVERVLEEMGVLKKSDNNILDMGFDFIASSGGNDYIVDVKYFRNKLGFGTVRYFLYSVLNSGKNGILIVSSGATERAKNLLLSYNKMSKNNQVFLVSGDSASEIKAQLQSIFDNGSVSV